MKRYVQCLVVLLALLVVIMVAGAMPVGAQGPLQEDTPSEDIWQAITFLYEQGETRYYAYQNTAGDARLYAREDDAWTDVTPTGHTWTEILHLWTQGETAYFALYEDLAPGLRGFVYKLENGTLSDMALPALPVGSDWDGFAFLEVIDGKGFFRFMVSSGIAALVELDGGVFNPVDVFPPLPLTWTDIDFLDRAGASRYFRFEDSSGNQHIYDEKATTTRSTQPQRVEAMTDRTPPGGPWDAISFLQVQEGKHYFHLEDVLANTYLFELDGDTWTNVMPAPEMLKDRCIYGDLAFLVFGDLVAPSTLKYTVKKLESGALVDLTPLPPVAARWKEIVCLTEVDGKAYQAFYEPTAADDQAYLYESDNDTYTDVTPADAIWKEIEVLGKPDLRQYFTFTESSTDEKRVYRKSAAHRASQPQQVESLEDITPAGTWKQITFQTDLADKDYFEYHDNSDDAYLYRLDGDTWQDATPSAETWRSIFFLTELGGLTYYEFIDDGGDAHFYQVQDDDARARLVILRISDDDYTPPGRWWRMRLLRQKSRKAYYRFDDHSEHAHFFTLAEFGTIVVEKETLPAGGSGFKFALNLDDLGEFELDGGANRAFAAVPPGPYTLTEVDPHDSPGRYDLTGLTCQDSEQEGEASVTDLETRTATINLDPGETVTCTFTNTERGKIVVRKETQPGGDPTAFDFGGKIAASLKDGQEASRLVPPGTYTVHETLPQGWDLAGIDCTGDGSGDILSAEATYRVEAGKTVTCTFTNRRRAKISVEKQTVPAGSDQAFSFTGAIGAGLKDDQIATTEVLPGTYRVTEALAESWNLTSIICDDGDSTGDIASGLATFRAAPGEHVTCTFTNTHDDVTSPPGTIVVAKETVPYGDPALFTFEGDAAGAISGGQRIVVSGLQAGTYTSRELLPQGWTLASIDCDDTDSSGDLATATATFRLQPDEAVICTFTNRRQYPLYLPLLRR